MKVLYKGLPSKQTPQRGCRSCGSRSNLRRQQNRFLVQYPDGSQEWFYAGVPTDVTPEQYAWLLKINQHHGIEGFVRV